MKCEEFMGRIDAYIDGELDMATVRAMQIHAQECVKCAQELRLANMLRETLGGMDDNIVPPLAAQAAWRGAVKAEAKKRKMRNIYKICSSAAAALVLAVGCFAGFNAMKDKPDMQEIAAPVSVSETIFVAADGDKETTAAFTGNRRLVLENDGTVEGINATVKLQAEDPLEACDAIAILATEYNGLTEAPDGSESSAYITAYIPAGNVDEFIASLELTGIVSASDIEGEDTGTATITITIKKE